VTLRGRPNKRPSKPWSPFANSQSAAAEAGRRALADGNYRLALRELNLAAGLRDRNPGLLAPAGDRELAQL
jgi:hypothetical protein